MSDFKAKMHQIRFQLGLRPRPRWGSLQSLQSTPLLKNPGYGPVITGTLRFLCLWLCASDRRFGLSHPKFWHGVSVYGVHRPR